jgi:hypothetical protein
MDIQTNLGPDAPLAPPAAREPTQDELLDGVADNLQRKTAATFLASASRPLLGDLPPTAFARYIENIVADSGASSDPVARMLVEQMTLAHHAVGGLLMRAAKSDSAEVAVNFLGAAARLMAEFRRGAETLQELRGAAVDQAAEQTGPAATRAA